MKAIYNARDEVEAQMVCSYLADAGIDSYAADSYSGEYLKVSSGFSVYGKDIYVNDEDESRARKIVESVLGEKESEDLCEDVKIPWYRNRAILSRIILGYIIVMAIVLVILTNIG